MNLAGQWAIDGDFTLYGDNKQFGVAGTTMKQDVSYQVQSYLRYKPIPQAETFVGLSQVWGGEKDVAGVRRGDALKTSKFMLGAGGFLRPTTHLAGLYSRDLSVRNGYKEANRIFFRLTQLF